jgi:hypothetical protein
MNSLSILSSPTATGNTALAAALTAVGIPLASKPFVRVVGDGIRGERIVWFFEPQSLCGKYDTKELIAAWGDESWHRANPEHPFAYIKCALRNREHLVDKVKQDVPLACVKRRGRIAFIPLDAPAGVEDFYLSRL